MNTETESSDRQENPFDMARSVLGEIQTHIQQQGVDAIKGGCWMAATEYLIETYGIKDATFPDKIAEFFKTALGEGEHADRTRATVQDALAEFRSEYNRLISE